MRTLLRRAQEEPSSPKVNGVDRPGPPLPVQKLQQPRRSRRPVLLALMVLTVAVSGVGAWYFIQKSAERSAVVGIARDVAWGQEITAADLVQVNVAADPALKPVSWDQRQGIVGQRAAADLPSGTLLTARSVTDGGQIPGQDQALVGVLVKAGQLPVTELSPQDRVLLVPAGAPGQPAGDSVESISAEVFTIGAADANGSRTVDVIVPEAAAVPVAVQAAAGRIAIVLVPRG